MTTPEIISGFPAGSITLDSENDTYWAGSKIAGTLKFILDVPRSFQAINMMFEGESRVHWTDSETEVVHNVEYTREIPYDGRENYFQFMIIVAGGPAGPVHLAPGMHSYNFEYQMPFKIPPSFESEIGQIEYRVVAFTDLGPDGQPNLNQSIIKMFRIVTPYDLNENPCSREALHFDFEETASGCFSCDSRPMHVRFSLPHTGFCPGQIIPIEVTADNSSSIEITKILISMRKKIEYHSKNPRSDMGLDDNVLMVLKKGPIPSNCQRSFTIDMEVPAELAMNFDNCELINISYYMRVELKLSGCNEDTEDEADIILGTIPLAGFQDTNYKHPLADQLPRKPLPTPEVPSVVYPTNTPYPTPTKPCPSPYPSPQNGYPGVSPPNLGFQVGNQDPPPYPGYPTGQNSYPTGQNSNPTGQNSYATGHNSYPDKPSPYPAGSSYPGVQYPPASNNSPAGWPASAPSAPPL